MKIEIEIPDDELRTCFSCGSGEMNLTLSVNETIDGYNIADIVSDVYDGNASLNFRKVEDEKMPFTEDQFFRITTNVRILARNLLKEGYSELQESIDQLIDYASSCHDKFTDQFHHDPRARRICPNPECHGIYAYFYEDFLYCPKCGTKLETGVKE